MWPFCSETSSLCIWHAEKIGEVFIIYFSIWNARCLLPLDAFWHVVQHRNDECHAFDAFPLNASETIDTDHDGVGNNADNDDDNDGIADGLDHFSLIPHEQGQKLLDIDGNGQIDSLTDSLLIMRYTFRFTGYDLIDGAIGGRCHENQSRGN